MAKAQLVEITRRAYFRITARGQDVLQSHPASLDVNFLSQYAEFREFKDRSRESQQQHNQIALPVSVEQKQTPDEVMRDAHHQIETALAQDLLDRILKAPPEFFERLIVNLLLSMGYGGSRADAGRALGRTGDDGINGVIDQDALGLDRVYVQAKRYAMGNNIGAGAIRDFFGSLDSLTMSFFSSHPI